MKLYCNDCGHWIKNDCQCPDKDDSWIIFATSYKGKTLFWSTSAAAVLSKKEYNEWTTDSLPQKLVAKTTTRCVYFKKPSPIQIIAKKYA